MPPKKKTPSINSETQTDDSYFMSSLSDLATSEISNIFDNAMEPVKNHIITLLESSVSVFRQEFDDQLQTLKADQD